MRHEGTDKENKGQMDDYTKKEAKQMQGYCKGS